MAASLLAGNPLPFSLASCLNLSELALDMEDTHLCIATTSADILSTLYPIERCRLERILLTTGCTYRLFVKEPRTKIAQAWGKLDVVLSELARVAIKRGERLSFILVSSGRHRGGCLVSGEKRLSELLPRFRELGSLRVDYGRSHRLGGARRLEPDCVYECYT